MSAQASQSTTAVDLSNSVELCSVDTARSEIRVESNTHTAAREDGIWRPDIDGLRALSVGAVVIYHVAQSFLRGGFVGVDVFFVISGYLITRNIIGRLKSSSFKITHFYEHRIRRIFPAYSVLLLAVLTFVLVFDLPVDAQSFGRTLLAALFSVTNIYFWKTTNYFSQSAEETPLLHTWSLSVEEQFYLIFPLLLAITYRRAGPWFERILLAAFAASLVGAIYGAFTAPTATFYLLPSRAWELILGSLLVVDVFPAIQTERGRNIAASSGLWLIGTSMVFFSPSFFPGLAPLPPCLGAALILKAGETGTSIVARLLSLRPVVFLGLISYSLYLWHWPVLAFQRSGTLMIEGSSKLIERLAVLVLSLLLATLSWLLVERLTRNRRLVSTRALLVGSGLIASILLMAGVTLSATGGLPHRFSPRVAAMARYLDYDTADQFRSSRCFLEIEEAYSTFDQTECLPNVQGEPNYLLFGDSHAAALAIGLRRILPDANVMQVTGAGCPPLMAPISVVSRGCPGLTDLATTILPHSRAIRTVWLFAQWNGGRIESSPDWAEGWIAGLEQTVDQYRRSDIEVILIGPSPEYDTPLPKLLAEGIARNDAALASRHLSQAPFVIDRRLAQFAADHRVPYLSLIDELCPTGKCLEYAAASVPAYFDRDHFTREASELVAGIVAWRSRELVGHSEGR